MGPTDGDDEYSARRVHKANLGGIGQNRADANVSPVSIHMGQSLIYSVS